MKKCPECTREIDKYAIACQYCKKLLKQESTDVDNPHSKNDANPVNGEGN